MKYYLIDYENVNAAGLEGIDEVTNGSRVVLFYTKNSSKIDLGVFNLLRSTAAELAVIEVHHGKQALDIQLASYVGFLIGTEPADTEYYIVSKDKGYRNIQDFWSDRKIVLCTSLRDDSEIVDEPKTSTRSRSSRGGRKSSSRSSAKAGEAESKSEKNDKAEHADKEEHAGNAEAKPDQRHSSKKGFRTKAEKNSKREKHDHVQDEGTADVKADHNPAEAAQAPAPEAPVVNAFAEAAALAAAMAAAKHSDDSSDSVIVKNAAPAAEDDNAKAEETKPKAKKRKSSKPKAKVEEPKADDAKASDAKADDAKANDAPKTKASALRNEANTEIQKILSKEGLSGDVINATASFVSKNIGKDGYKQLIYRGLIKDNGREQGLAIYRLIKGVL